MCRHAVTAAVKFEIDNSNNKGFRNGWALSFYFFLRYRHLHKIIFLDNIDVINSANLGIYVTSAFDKNSKKQFADFTFPPVFDNFDLPNDLKIQI